MFKITDKRRARYLLEVRDQGGHRFLHFVRTNKMRYIALVIIDGGLLGYFAAADAWFFFWVFASLSFGSIVADLSWLRGMKKSWPFMSRALNWDEVKKISDE
jgi:hypothetical protein